MPRNAQVAIAYWCNKHDKNDPRDCKGDNPFIKALGVASRSDAQTIHRLTRVIQNRCIESTIFV